MKNDEIWRVFAETGDPVAYLLYRSAAKAQSRSHAETKEPAG